MLSEKAGKACQRVVGKLKNRVSWEPRKGLASIRRKLPDVECN